MSTDNEHYIWLTESFQNLEKKLESISESVDNIITDRQIFRDYYCHNARFSTEGNSVRAVQNDKAYKLNNSVLYELEEIAKRLTAIKRDTTSCEFSP